MQAPTSAPTAQIEYWQDDMAKNPSYRAALFSSTMAGFGTAELMAGIQYSDKPLIGYPLIVGGLVSFGWAISPLFNISLYRPRRSTAMDLIKDFTRFQIRENEQGGYTARFKEKPVDEYIFSHKSLPCSIPSNLLIDFIRIGHKREKNARTGFDYGIGDKLQIHQAWGKGYFTKKRRLRFSPDQYESCIAILVFCRQHEGRRAGTPGNLIHHYLPASQIYERTERRWRYFFDRSPAQPPTLLNRLIKKWGVPTPLYRLAQA